MHKSLLLGFLMLFLISFSANASSSKIKVYFNWPEQSNGLQEAIVGFIDGAQSSLDISIYQLDNKAIVDAIERAAKRLGSSNVRLVTESHYYHMSKYTGYKKLESDGVKIVPDDSYDGNDRGQCHHKFIIRDKNSILTGSTNFTHNGIYANNNNSIIVYSPKLVPAYQEEFNQMFEQHLFSRLKHSISANRVVTIDNIKIESYFSPYDKIRQHILKAISTAQHSIAFCMFAFTDDDIQNAIIEKYNQGVAVYGTLDRWQSTSSYSAYHPFKDNGIDVHLDIHKGFLHHKFIVIDAGTNSDPTVITGSYNYTTSADYNNDENVLVIHDRDIADKYFAQAKKNYGENIDINANNSSMDSSSSIAETNNPQLLISEVSFKSTNGDWIEIYCRDDGNNGNGADIGNFYFEDDNIIKMVREGTTIKTGQYLLLTQNKDLTKFDETSATNGIIHIYAKRVGLVSTDEQVILRDKKGEIVDAVCWSNHNGKYSPGEKEDMAEVYKSGNWNSPNESSCIDSTQVKNNWTITRDSKYIDTNSSKDWIITNKPTPGKPYPDGVSTSFQLFQSKVGTN
jgi:hypothetical protein